MQEMLGPTQVSLQEIVIEEEAFEGQLLVGAEVWGILLAFKKAEYLGKRFESCLAVLQDGVQEIEFERGGQLLEPAAIEGRGDHLDDRGKGGNKIAALIGDKLGRIFDKIKILGVNANSHLPHRAPAAGGPFAVVVGCRGLFLDNPGIEGEVPFFQGLSGENLNETGNTSTIRSCQS